MGGRLMLLPRASFIGVVVALVLGCNVRGTPQPLTLGITNGTSVEVGLYVNGQQVGVVLPFGPQPSIDPAALPALPWHVEARSASGRVLTQMDVTSADVAPTEGPDGVVINAGTFSRVDLSCGRLTIWAAGEPPSGGPPAASGGQAGDCA
jgi:hypothetical protein